MKHLIRAPLIRSSIVFTLAIFTWVLFAPTYLGGQVIYVVVNGNSMQPIFNKGDLVLLHRVDYYRLGDIVAYTYPESGKIIHRIIGRNGERYILRGDHNDWTDSYQPLPTEIVGKYWLLLPKAGNLLVWLRNPLIMGSIVGLSTLFLGVPFVKGSGSKRKKISSNQISNIYNRVAPFLAVSQESYSMFVYSLGIVSMVLAIYVFTRPLEQKISDDIPYDQSGSFAYSSSVVSGVYDNDRLGSGDVIFPQVNCNIILGFDYDFQSDAELIGAGRFQLAAEVGTQTGWHRQLNLQPVTTFKGSAFHTETVLDICQVQQIIKLMQQTTGVMGGVHYLTVTPNIYLFGYLGGRPIEADFSPPMTFTIEDQQIYLNKSMQEDEDVLKPTLMGSLVGFRTAPNTLNIFKLAIPIKQIRVISVVGLALALAGWALSYIILKRAQKSDVLMASKLTLGSRMVEAVGVMVGNKEQTVEVSSCEDLVRIAERLGLLVFFQQDGSGVNYTVRDGSTIYLYRKIVPQKAVVVPALDISKELRRVIENGELFLHYQPIVSLQTGKISQVEALLRWQHPVHGLQMPMDFLPQAEQAGHISHIDQWVLRNGCAQLSYWREMGYPLIPLGINVSYYQLRQPGFDRLVKDTLSEFDLSANLIHIEVQEFDLDQDEFLMANLKSFKEMGIGIAVNKPLGNGLDDAGAPRNANQIKIGRSLVRELTRNPSLPENALRWISIAHERNINIVAVGVETSEQLGFFRLNSFDEVQGFLISPPLPPEEFAPYLIQDTSLFEIPAKKKRSRSRRKLENS